jgi:hypothetical protein
VADPSGRSGRQYTEEEVRAILERALRRDQERGGVDHEALLAAAQEVGIPRSAIEAAARELPALQSEQVVRQTILDRRRKKLHSSLFSFISVNLVLFVIDILTPGGPWFFWPLLFWGLVIAFRLRSVITGEIKPRELRRELERMEAEERKERKRREKEERAAARRARDQRFDESVEEFGQAVEDGVELLMNRIAKEIRGVTHAEPPPGPGRVEHGPGPRVRVGADKRAKTPEEIDAEIMAEAEEEAEAAARGEMRRR